MQLTETKGRRVKLARNMLGLSRKEVEERFKISANTLQAWESNKNNLTNKGAKKLNYAFTQSGLLCSEDWLLTGKGQTPFFMQNNSACKSLNEDFCILREIEAFKAINPNPVVVIISDDGMEPIYSPGDFVGGNIKLESRIRNLIGENCIIETSEGDVIVRKLLRGNNDQCYNLVCINITTQVQPIIPDVEVKSAAKIILHRKKEDPSRS